MEFGLSEEQNMVVETVRSFVETELYPLEAELERTGALPREVARDIQDKVLEMGFYAPNIPEEHGGGGLDNLTFALLERELGRTSMGLNHWWGRPSNILCAGTPEQRERYLIPCARGERHDALAMTEPDAGSDVSAIKTRAVRDGDEWVINGQKTWTSLASDADYCWLAVRTDPDAAKHAGLSIIVVDLKNTSGIRIDPLDLLSEHDINQVFFDDVRVPAANLVGGENKGWKLITGQLNHERVTICSAGILDRAFEETRRWAQKAELSDGSRVIDQQWVQVNLARVYSGLEFLRLINWKVAWTSTQGTLSPADASTIKIFGTEFYLDSFRLLMEIMGQRGYLKRGSPEAIHDGQIESLYRGLLILTFGGGTNEIQRDLIGLFGLSLPRIPRH